MRYLDDVEKVDFYIDILGLINLMDFEQMHTAVTDQLDVVSDK